MTKNQYKVIYDSEKKTSYKNQRGDFRHKNVVRTKVSSKGVWFKRIVLWSILSLVLQVSFYYFLNVKIEGVMNPSNSSQMSIFQSGKFSLAATNIKDPMISYDDNYLAYSSGSEFSIYDLSQHKEIWHLDQTGSKKVLGYQWLPDRSDLLIFESGIGVDPDRPGSMCVGIHTLEMTGDQNNVSDRFASSLPLSFQDSQISDISLSTATNLIYFSVRSQSQSNLYEVDVMKNLIRLNRPGEKVDTLAVSPVKGTVYYNAQGTANGQTMAENGNSRVQVASNPLDKVLGLWNEKLYLGTVDNGDLVKVWTISDDQPSAKRPDFTLFWTGQIPWNKSSLVSNNGDSLLVRTDQTLYQISPQGSKILKEGEQYFFSTSGKYYYAYNTNDSGTTLERIKL